MFALARAAFGVTRCILRPKLNLLFNALPIVFACQETLCISSPFLSIHKRTFSWKNPKPIAALKRAAAGKQRKNKIRTLRSLKDRFMFDEDTGLLKHRGIGRNHYRWKKSYPHKRRLRGWKLLNRRTSKKLLRFMNL